MTEIFNFENLAAYQRSMDLVEHIYTLLRKFPREEQYALCDQLRRSVTSIPSNIAEGMGRYSNKEKVHFIEIAYASLMEVYCQLNISKRLGYITEAELSELRLEIQDIARPTSDLRNSLIPNL